MSNGIERGDDLREIIASTIRGVRLLADDSTKLGTGVRVGAVDIQGETVTAELLLGFPCVTQLSDLSHRFHQAVSSAISDRNVILELKMAVRPHAVQTGLRRLPTVKNVIAVASGKGGVGKSTTALQLALALSRLGASVGLLDADIYGPNQPQLLGATEKPILNAQEQFEPIIKVGLQSISMGNLVDDKTPMIWRGPMVSGALEQLFFKTAWRDLDYLVVDMPPGTGDIPLTLAKKIPVVGAVVVTTPQSVALSDVRRAVRMFDKVQIPVLGVVENMSYHVCSGCGHHETIFGEGGGLSLAAEWGFPLLGQVPLTKALREEADAGVSHNEQGRPWSSVYEMIALRLAHAVALRPKDFTGQMPRVVVEKE